MNLMWLFWRRTVAAGVRRLWWAAPPPGGAVASPQSRCITASKFIISSHSLSLHPSLPPDTSISAAALFFWAPSLTSCCISAAGAAGFHFQTHANAPPGRLMPPTIREAGASLGLTCLCCSRSALFPTRIMGNSSLSFTRRICLWNL